MYDALIVSDIHLGSDVCQSKKIVEFLKLIEEGQLQTKEIIVNGDLFDSWDFRKLKGSHWKVLSKMRSLAKTKHIVWINGNHDGPAEIISHLIGVDFVEEYRLKSGEKEILVLHGDRFDNFIAKYPLFTKLADKIYRLIQIIDRSFYLAKLAKKSSKTFLRCSEQIKERAISYARKKGAKVVCCGHTHLATEDANGEVLYYNGGCWTESPCSYISVSDGTIKIHHF
ncbi:UDP-2,3-diacylglucosamine diphosphatase [bacterium]|nr:UDP-2,3-diacylglucosamine diphosphatase [bacterium]